MINLEQALEILKKYNIKTEDELENEIKANEINIGIFTAHIEGKENQNS